jgi:hypothetical protein
LKNATRIENKKRGWDVDVVQSLDHLIDRSEFELLVAECAEVVYLCFSQLPENLNPLALEPALRNDAEKVEIPNAA